MWRKEFICLCQWLNRVTDHLIQMGRHLTNFVYMFFFGCREPRSADYEPRHDHLWLVYTRFLDIFSGFWNYFQGEFSLVWLMLGGILVLVRRVSESGALHMLGTSNVTLKWTSVVVQWAGPLTILDHFYDQ